MIINILLPYKEKFDEKKASSVSITVKNNLFHSDYLKCVRIFGKETDNPLFKENFYGFKYSYLSLKSKNKFLADKMCKTILESSDKRQLIEIHNRPYLINHIAKATNFPISLFLHNDPQKMKGAKSVEERENILKKCVAVLCVSQYVKSQFVDGISYNNKNIHVLYNGVDRKLKKFPKKKKEILFVGRLVSEKGVHLYVGVVESLAKKFTDWSFSLIGSHRLGDNNNNNLYAQEIIKKFKNIGRQAQFYGFRDYDFVQNKMKDASIIVIPSLWEEPFGLVASEAMSNGTSIIASKVGGIPEIVGKNGILIENINFKKLQKSLFDLMNNDHLRESYQNKAWKNFKFSSSISSKKLDKLRKVIVQNYF